MVYDISNTSQLSGAETAAHIHRGAPGVIGPVVYPLPAGNPKSGAQTLTISDTNDLLTGQFYVNIHTEDSQGGDIRGQIGADACQLLLPVITKADSGPVLANGQTP